MLIPKQLHISLLINYHRHLQELFFSMFFIHSQIIRTEMEQTHLET